MKKQKSIILKMDEPLPISNPFDLLTEEIIFAILDSLNDDAFSKKSFSLVCKSFYFIESRHRKTLRPLSSDLVLRTLKRYRFVSELDLSLCPRVDDAALTQIASSRSSLRSINLSRSRLFTHNGLSSLVANCAGLVEIDLSNRVELTDMAAAAIAEAKNLERLSLARCKMITDMGIGCVAVGCKKLRFINLKWCLRVSDLGVGLIAMKCKQIRAMDLSYVPITEKCLPPILELEHLEDLVLEGCPGIDDDGLATLKHSSKSLKTLNMSNCQHVSHVGLSSLTHGAEYLQHIFLSYSVSVTADLAKCLHNISGLQSIKLDGCSVTTSGIKAIGNWLASLKELSLSKCLGVTDECLSFLVQTHKELRKLDITCCYKITYASIDSITNSCTSLTSLRMESCSLVSKDPFELIGQRCRFLEELDVTDNEIDNEGLKSISRCSKLLTLKLGICSNITNDGLTHVENGCSKLKELDLYSVSLTRNIWKASIHERLKMHLWRIAFNLLPTGDKLSEFSPSSDTSCPLCNAETESALHLFTHCHIARAIWFGSRWKIRIDSWHVQSPSHLIELLLDPPPCLQLDKEQRNEFLLFGALALDLIWLWRNKAINEKSLPMEGQIIRSIQKLFLEHWQRKAPVLTSVPARNSARWCFPSQGMLKLNCDAAVGDLSSCIAVVARDWRGMLVFAISKKVNTNIPVQVEANAILLAAHIALNFAFCNCIIESDCKVCIDAIRAGGKEIPWRLVNFVDSVKNVFRDSNHVFFNWVHREANQVAHVLANWSLSQSFFGSFDMGFGPPSFVDVILDEAVQASVSVVVQ